MITPQDSIDKDEQLKEVKEVKDELQKEKDEGKKKPESKEGILDRLTNFFTGLQDKEISDKSYVPLDKSTKDLIKISREELKELRDVEKKLNEQIKGDKLTMHQYKNMLTKQLIQKYNQLQDKDSELEHKKKLTEDKIDYLNDQLDESTKGKLKFLEEKERIIESKLKREKEEIDELRDIYVDKLNKDFSREYKRMKNSYDTRLRKQKHTLLNLIKDYGGDNIYIKELLDKLKNNTEIPIMVHKRRTIHKNRKDRGARGVRGSKKVDKGYKKTKKKFKHPEDGVYSVIDFLSN